MDLVQARIDREFIERSAELSRIAPELSELAMVAAEASAGGKRFRALFAYWGWHAVRARSEVGPGGIDDPLEHIDTEQVRGIVGVASALELFHAAALVHDDLMDHSDTRRGRPAAHRRFENLRTELGAGLGAARFGEAAALLLGDLLIGWSDELFTDSVAVEEIPAPSRLAVREEFVRMRTEVTAGQFLDILEESDWWRHEPATQLERAERVVLFKSAKYSVEAPLAIGAALAGADTAQLAALRAYGVPVGIAFQLKDDLLGVFGDPEVTGKPAGDDLREGKRTVLLALTRQRLRGGTLHLFDELVGDPGLDAEQIELLRATIRDTGAVEGVEARISEQLAVAARALDDAQLSRSAVAELRRLAAAVGRRDR